MWGLGQRPKSQLIMDNAQCIISRFDDSLKFLFLHFFTSSLIAQVFELVSETTAVYKTACRFASKLR
jgi:hypothetical protein